MDSERDDKPDEGSEDDDDDDDEEEEEVAESERFLFLSTARYL